MVDPSDPNRVLVGGHQGAAVSADGGTTWRPIDGLAGADPMGLVIDPRDRRLLYAAGHPGFRRSLDGGGTWSDQTGTLPGTDVHGLGMDPRHPDVLYAYVVGQGILQSADRGAHWAVVNTTQSLMGPILVDPRAGTTLYLADSQGGFQESVDGGRTWRQVGSIPNGMAIFWVSQDQNRPQTFYAATGGIWRSDDGGRTWQALAGAPSGVTTVAVAPSDPHILYAAALQGTEAQVFRSADGGITGRRATEGSTADRAVPHERPPDAVGPGRPSARPWSRPATRACPWCGAASAGACCSPRTPPRRIGR